MEHTDTENTLLHFEFVDRYCQEHNYVSENFVDQDTDSILTLLWIDKEDAIAFGPIDDCMNEKRDTSRDSIIDIFFKKDDLISISVSLDNPTYQEFTRVLDMIVAFNNRRKK